MDISTAEIDDEIRLVARPTSWADARRRLVDFSRRWSFDHTTYISISPRGQKAGGIVFVTTAPQPWVERYKERRYITLDPVFPMARRSQKPFIWADIEENTAESRAFFEEAAAMGAGSQGLTIPIHGPEGERALFSVTSSRPETDFRAHCAQLMPLLQIIGFEFHRGMAELTRPILIDRKMLLTPRERDVLYWAAAGKTVWETSLLLGISEVTTNSYLRTAVRRLDGLNKPHAVAEAIRRGLI